MGKGKNRDKGGKGERVKGKIASSYFRNAFPFFLYPFPLTLFPLSPVHRYKSASPSGLVFQRL
jgi:hypothetical protein